MAPHAAATHGLYERHAAKIQSYCHHQLGSREEAEDAVQTTFMNAFRALGRGVVPEAESAWLFKIAENVCLSRRRSTWRRGKIESPSDFDLIEEVIPGPNRQRDELIGIEDALASMPEQQRRAILLREWQGLSYREVAEELEISQSAVETLIFRARRTLAQGLEEPERTKPKRKSFRRALHVVDFGTLVAAAKTLLAGSAAVKATAAAVAVTAAAGTVATVAPKIEPRSHHLASAPKHVVAAPSAPDVVAQAAAAPSFSSAAAHAGEPGAKPALAAPKRAKQRATPAQLASRAAPVAAAPVSRQQQQPAEQPAAAPKAEPHSAPASEPVAAAPVAVEKINEGTKDERRPEGAVSPIVPLVAQPGSTLLPTEGTGGGGTPAPDVTVPAVPEASAPVTSGSSGRSGFGFLPPPPPPPPAPAPAPVTSSAPAPTLPPAEPEPTPPSSRRGG